MMKISLHIKTDGFTFIRHLNMEKADRAELTFSNIIEDQEILILLANEHHEESLLIPCSEIRWVEIKKEKLP